MSLEANVQGALASERPAFTPFAAATEIARRVASGQTSAVDVMKDCLARIERLDPTIHAWAHVAPDVALAHAAFVDAQIAAGETPGTLAGVPLGVKDVYNTSAMPTQMGSPIFHGFTPGNDARVVFDLRRAGAVFPGKTVTAEFAVHTPGPTRNPHDPRCMPGTSSSGSAASVAAGMVPVAIGTQTAGSIIRPASYCGVYGFKPSFGLLPRTGMLKTTDSLDTVGYFARHVGDLLAMFDTTRVRGLDYPVSNAALSDPKRQHKGDRPWRIGVIENPPRASFAEPYAVAALAEYAERLGRTPGVEVVRVTLPEGMARAHDVHATIYDKTLSYYFKEEFDQHTLISPVMYAIVERGRALSLDQYKAALADQSAIAAVFDAAVDDCDAWLTLSTGGAALEGLDNKDRPDSCLVWTLCGAPTVSVPAFMHGHLPFGAQLIGRRYDDYKVLDLARHLESSGLGASDSNALSDPC
jgi:Asp-tRNA(Asn)/Glu-tRNA(Gln) amidotransferase A subunit family amidase